MRKTIFILSATILLTTAVAWIGKRGNEQTYKCLIQLTNYQGEGAYVIVSLMNPEGNYERTLHIIGEDDEWYSSLSSWWMALGEKGVDATTGATVSGGERTMCVLSVDESKLNAGYKLRFETAVEGQEYNSKDVEIPLNTDNLRIGKFEGSVFIRYVRLISG